MQRPLLTGRVVARSQGQVALSVHGEDIDYCIKNLVTSVASRDAPCMQQVNDTELGK
jgi:hypothetical protein